MQWDFEGLEFWDLMREKYRKRDSFFKNYYLVEIYKIWDME